MGKCRVASAFVGVVTAVVFVGCVGGEPDTSSAPLFSGEEAMLHVERQVALGPRPTGSETSRQTGEYILETLAATGWTTEKQQFEYLGVQGQNLIGRSSNAGKPVIVLGAHYDTRRVADNDPLAPDQPVLGANDGASGVAVLLELARTLDVSRVNGDVWLVFFDAEDNGNLDGWDWIVGSRYFVDHLTTPVMYAIVVDMVGDADQNIYLEGNSDAVLRTALWNTARDMGLSDFFIAEERHFILDDHTPFLGKDIPAVDIIDFDYAAWHTTGDTVDKVSSISLERVGRVLERFLESGGEYPAK